MKLTPCIILHVNIELETLPSSIFFYWGIKSLTYILHKHKYLPEMTSLEGILENADRVEIFYDVNTNIFIGNVHFCLEFCFLIHLQ